VTTVPTSDTGKSIVKIATIKIAVHDQLDIRPEKAVGPFKAFLIDLFECFKMVFNAPIVRRIMRIARPVNRASIEMLKRCQGRLGGPRQDSRGDRAGSPRLGGDPLS